MHKPYFIFIQTTGNSIDLLYILNYAKLHVNYLSINNHIRIIINFLMCPVSTRAVVTRFCSADTFNFLQKPMGHST